MSNLIVWFLSKYSIWRYALVFLFESIRKEAVITDESEGELLIDKGIGAKQGSSQDVWLEGNIVAYTNKKSDKQ